MFANESLSDTEDPLPRNAPKPSINNSDKFSANPSVPEVSIIFDQSTKPIHNLIADRKSIIKSTPIIKTNLINEENPIPAKATIPELSLIFEPNGNSYSSSNQIHSTLKENVPQEQIQINNHNKPSLPVKSFSSFKLKYGSLISSMENTTRKTVKFKPINQNCIKNIEKNIEQLDINEIDEDLITEPEITENHNYEHKTDTNKNNIILDRLDSLTILVNSLFNEIKDVQSDIKVLKTTIKNDTKESTNCQNCNNLNYKIDEIIEFNKYIFDNIQNLNKNIILNESVTNKNNYEDLENITANKQEINLNERSAKTNNERNPIPTYILPLKSAARPITNPFKKSDLLETLPETEPILIFNNDINRSLAMKELELKYLNNDNYKIYINNNNNNTLPVDLKTNCNYNKIPIINEEHGILKKSTDLSIATYDYMKKYKLIIDDNNKFINEPINYENNNLLIDKDNLLVFQDIKKGPKLM